MSLEAYKVFKTVVEKKSFLRAAEALYLTPSAVNYSISRLENKLALTLFIREKNGVRLTREGKEVLSYIEEILEDQEKLNQAILSIKGSESGVVYIGTCSSVCVSWIPDLVQSFSELYPHIKILVHQGNYQDVFNWLKEGSVHIGFLPDTFTGSVEITPLYKDLIMCVTPMDFIPKNKNYVSMEELKSMDFVYKSEGYDMEANYIIKKLGLKAHSQFVIEDSRSLMAMIECGLGISLMPKLLVDSMKHKVKAYPLEPPEYSIIGLGKRKNQGLLPAAAKMFGFIIDYFHRNQIYNL